MDGLNNDTSYLGRFWLPSQGEGTAVSGVLDLGPEGGIVRLEGALTPTGLLQDAVVFAKLQGWPEKATLFNCYAHARRKSDGTVVSSKIESTRVALGSLNQELGGHAVQFQLPGSATWFHEKCFDAELESDCNALVRFKSSESTRYPLLDGLTLERFYSAAYSVGHWGSEEFVVSRPMGFRFLSPARRTFDDLWMMKIHLRRLLEFLSQQHFPHEQLGIFDQVAVGRQIPDVHVWHSSIFAVKRKKFDWDEQLVKYDEVEARFPQMLISWFDVYRRSPEPFDRYFAAFDRSRSDGILHFLWNVAALEELHKLRTTRAKRKYSLLSRLQDVRSRWSSAFKVMPPDDVLESIKDSRNYYAHAAGDLREKAASDWLLLRYGDFIAAICNLEILALLGFSDDEVVQLTNHYWMSSTLSLKKYPRLGGKSFKGKRT